MPAPVLSRSCLTCSAEMFAIVAISVSLIFSVGARRAVPLHRTNSARAVEAGAGESVVATLRAGGRRRRFDAALRPHRARQAGGGVGGCRFLGALLIFLGDPRLPLLAAAGDRLGNLRREQPDRPQRIVVARDHVVDFVRVAVGVDDADDRYLQLARLVDRDLLLARVDDEDRVRQPRHVADALEVLEQLALLLLVPRDLLLRERVIAAVGDHRLEVPEPAEAALDRREVGEQSAEPALVDVVHAAALRFLGDDVLRLPLRSDEEERPAVCRKVGDERFSVPELLDRLVQIENVDSVPLSEDVLLHLRVPPFRLVAEMGSGLQQFLHRNPGQQILRSLTFAELEALARASHTVLLAFLDARVGRQEAVLLQLFAQLGVEGDERARDSELDGAGLAVDAAASHGREHVELLAHFRQQQRPLHLRAQGVGRKVALELAMVDGDGARAGAEEHAGGGCLAAGRCVIFVARQVYATSIFFGCWAECGCSAPAYTFSFRNIASPILVFGSMPRTASSTRRIGCRFRTSTARSSRRPPSKPLCRRYSF